MTSAGRVRFPPFTPTLPHVYVRRTSRVRVTWVFTAYAAFHTGWMAAVVKGSFDDVVLPHLDAGYRLARWLVRNEHDAEDVVQDAALRALRYFGTFSGGNARAWFLRIVRNSCWNWMGRPMLLNADPFDEERHTPDAPVADPETIALRTDDVARIRHMLASLPVRFRELLVLRELEGLSYRELSDVLGIPMGTVMSGLSRARQAARVALESDLTKTRPVELVTS